MKEARVRTVKHANRSLEHAKLVVDGRWLLLLLLLLMLVQG